MNWYNPAGVCDDILALVGLRRISNVMVCKVVNKYTNVCILWQNLISHLAVVIEVKNHDIRGTRKCNLEICADSQIPNEIQSLCVKVVKMNTYFSLMKIAHNTGFIGIIIGKQNKERFIQALKVASHSNNKESLTWHETDGSNGSSVVLSFILEM